MPQRIALIGKPLRRPHGALMHNAACLACGIDASAELVELDTDELPTFIEGMRHPDWLGFQVTAPYKQRVIELLDVVEDEALEIGAVNTGVRLGDGSLIGFNTDAPGWLAAVERDLHVTMHGLSVLLLGAGGVAHAIAHACVANRVARLTIANRTLEAAQHLAAKYSVPDSIVQATVLNSRCAETALVQADLVVNATVVGMTTPGPLVDVSACQRDTAVFDVVFCPARTELVRTAEQHGMRAANGVGMLVAQATLAFERWTGCRDVFEVMQRSIQPLLNVEHRHES